MFLLKVTMTDQLITVSLYSSALAYPVHRNTKLLLKGNQSVQFTRPSSLFTQLIMEPNKKTSKCGDFLHKGSSFLSFLSMLLIVAMFLRMESINRKTEMNEVRIYKVESLIQNIEAGSPQTTDNKNEMETSESK